MVNNDYVEKVNKYCKEINTVNMNIDNMYETLEIIMYNIMLANLETLIEIKTVLVNNSKGAKKNTYCKQFMTSVNRLIKLKENKIPTPIVSVDNPSRFYKQIAKYYDKFDLNID